MRTLLRALSILMSCGVAAACAHGKGSVELSAQSMDSTEPTPEPAASSSAVSVESTPAPPSSAQPPAPMVDYPACPVDCRILRPHLRLLTNDEKDRIRGAIGGTLNGLKSCIYGGDAQGAYVRPPPVNLRFNDQGDLVDVGVDSQGYDQNLEACFQSLAHGQSAMPVVKLDSGAATVLCTESCPAPARAAGKRKKK